MNRVKKFGTIMPVLFLLFFVVLPSSMIHANQATYAFYYDHAISLCQNNKNTFKVNSIHGYKTCKWANGSDRRCSMAKVRLNCPATCDLCARKLLQDDIAPTETAAYPWWKDTTDTFVTKGPWGEETKEKGCPWVKNKQQWRCSFLNAKKGCPETCKYCHVPSSSPSDVPSSVPSLTPSVLPSSVPSSSPSDVPSSVPSLTPSVLLLLNPVQIRILRTILVDI
jgi:hypothetical protein